MSDLIDTFLHNSEVDGFTESGEDIESDAIHTAIARQPTLRFSVAELQKRLGFKYTGQKIIVGEEHGVILREMLNLDYYDGADYPVTIVFPKEIVSADYDFGPAFMGKTALFLEIEAGGKRSHYSFMPEVYDEEGFVAIGKISHRIGGTVHQFLMTHPDALAYRERHQIPEVALAKITEIHQAQRATAARERAELEATGHIVSRQKGLMTPEEVEAESRRLRPILAAKPV